jgi:hypothetical protein
LDKTFRLFFPQKVPAVAGIGGKIQVIDYLKIGKTPHPTPHTPHPAPRKSFFSKPYLCQVFNNFSGKKFKLF